MRLPTHLLHSFIRAGALSLVETNGAAHSFGYPPGPAIAVRLHDTRLHTGLALNPGLYAAEAYMAGTLTFEGGSGVHDLLLLGNNQRRLAAVPSQQALRLHYHTPRHWRTRFAGRRDKVPALTYERFVYMWEFNLFALGMDFLRRSHMVFQMLLSPKRDAAPIVQDYMARGTGAA
jgi:hypothetical protein